jgi:hypothetical protein
MFAPNGYMSLDEVFDNLRDVAYQWRLETPHEDDPNPGPTYTEDNFSLSIQTRLGEPHTVTGCFSAF